MKKTDKTHYPVRGWCLPQWLLFMRNLCIILCICSFQLYASENTSAQKITLKISNSSLKTIIEAIEQQTKLGFLYNEKEISVLQNLNIDAHQMEVIEVLDQLLGNSPLSYRINNQTILITKRVAKATPEAIKTWIIQGCVTDKNKNPLPGVSISIKGTSFGVATDVLGNYKLEIPGTPETTLLFSFVGMKSQEIKVSGTKTLNIVMEEDNTDLDEVTVVAYGERKKRELISSISSVKAEDIKEVPSASIENLLQGHMAGVEVSNISGSPGGGGTRVTIRGYNSLMEGMNDGTPLYVVDGVPVNSFTSPLTGTNTLAEIDPATIESVEVLKDAASAAIYGSRAGNGVILITTKQGKVGRATFSANVSYSYSILPETPTQIMGHGERLYHLWTARNERIASTIGSPLSGFTYQMPTSYEDTYINRSGTYDYFWGTGWSLINQERVNSPVRYLQDSLNPFYNNSTNWWKYAFRAGEIINANLQASGGTERVKYLVGAGWYKEKGIMLGTDFKRVNLITNLNITPRTNFKIDARLYLAYTDRNRGKGEVQKIEGLSVNPKGQKTYLPGDGSTNEHLLEMMNEISDKNQNINLRPSLTLSYEFIKGLSLRASLAADYSQGQYNSFTPSFMDSSNGFSISSGGVQGNMMFQNEELLNYHFSIKDKHNFDILGGFSYIRNSSTLWQGSGKGSPSNKIYYVVDGFPTTAEIGTETVAMQSYNSDFTEKISVSGFGRIAYNYQQKYLTEITLRRDGSSVFGEDVRWATFPSIALGWAFSEENFMKNLWWLSYGKLRASWGTSGQQFSQPYLAHGTLGVGDVFLGQTGIQPTSILTTKLQWEESDQYDLGLDADFFDYRLKFKLDYYYKYSKSVLWNTPLPGNVYYLSNAWQNALEVSNEGIELEFLADIFRNSAVTWRARFNISRNWNRFEKSYSGMDVAGNSGPYVIGRPLFGLYVYKNEGYVQTENDIPYYYDAKGNKRPLNMGNVYYPYQPGMNLYADMNEDGSITPDDMYYAASTLPLAHGGFANEVKWKDFDLNVLFTFSLKRKMINALQRTSLELNHQWTPIYVDYRDKTFWEQAGDNSDYPSVNVASGVYGQYSLPDDKSIEDVSFVRLKQLTLGYNVPKSFVKKINLEGVRIFFTAENLFLLTNYSGIDPETVDPTSGYDNFSNYPLARKLTLGLTVNF